jgi:hypothetical protein
MSSFAKMRFLIQKIKKGSKNLFFEIGRYGVQKISKWGFLLSYLAPIKS